MTQPITTPWSKPIFPPLPHAWSGVRIAALPFTPRPGGVAIEAITKTQLEIVSREQELGQARFRAWSTPWDALAEVVPDTEAPPIVMLSDNTIPAGETLKQIKRGAAA